MYVLIYCFKSHKIRERNVKILTRNWRDHWRTGTWKHTETVSRNFDRHGSLYQSWLKKTAVPVEISRYSFSVFSCASPSVISSISGRSFHFPFPYFVIFVVWYFPFHVVCFKSQLQKNTISWHQAINLDSTITYISCLLLISQEIQVKKSIYIPYSITNNSFSKRNINNRRNILTNVQT